MIWFFDSGIGGLLVMEEFQKQFPDIPMIFEHDSIHCPYWNRESEDIRILTKQWVDRLFSRGATVVILACNTASVHALRWLQQEIYPERHILGVTIPWAEHVVEQWYKKVGVLATDATVRIRAYKERVHILDNTIHIEEVWIPGLVDLIEAGKKEGGEVDALLRGAISRLSPDREAIILWCTHYPYVEKSVEKIWQEVHGNSLPDIVDPGKEAALRFRSWLLRKRLFLPREIG